MNPLPFSEQDRTPEHYKRNEKSSSAGCAAALVIGFIALLVILFCSCSPYQRVSEPVRMNYSIDGILCRDYQTYGNTLIMYDAGWYSQAKTQRRVTEVKLIGGNHIIVKL